MASLKSGPKRTRLANIENFFLGRFDCIKTALKREITEGGNYF
jgi:hypothetical protein